MANKSLVLVIDDEPIIQQTLSALLDEEKFDLSFAGDGEQGFIMAQALLPDIIILDIMLPGMDGYEVCRLLRKHPQLAEVPIIMLTALDDRDSKLTGLLAGADTFLVKPFDTVELQIRLRTILQINRYRRLVAERARFAWIVENAEDGYLLLDQFGCIQFANAKAQVLLHLPAEYISMDFFSQVEKIYTPRPSAKWASWLTSPSLLYLVQAETPHSRAFWLLVDAIDTPSGNENSRVVRLSDVTEKMSNYHVARKFHTAVAHKLRTPASFIYSSLEMLNSRFGQAPLEETKPLLETAWHGAQRLVGALKDILSYLDAPLAMQTGDFAALGDLPGLIEKVSENLEMDGVQLTLPAELSSTPIRLTNYALELILSELLENSKKFHPQHAPKVEVKVEPLDSDTVCLSIIDDGLTLTAEQLSWACLPYFQGEKSFSGEVPGMGLGIPTVAALAWQAGGDVHLANCPAGPGIVVELAIPVMWNE